MDNKEIQEKYRISKKTGIGILIQTILLCLALVLTIIGIIAKYDSVQRVIVYSGQAAVCLGFILLGFVHFKDRDRNLLGALLCGMARTSDHGAVCFHDVGFKGYRERRKGSGREDT